jgi:predicted nucleic acid-binding protein
VSANGKLVVDASVAIKWYVPEQASIVAVEVLTSGDELLAPDLLVAELGNILWKKVRRGELTARDADQIADAFLSTRPIRIRDSAVLLRGALDIATAFDRTVYDALYLALAVAEGCQMVTADGRLVHALQGSPLERAVKPLTLS